jgi:hypothetical protein
MLKNNSKVLNIYVHNDSKTLNTCLCNNSYSLIGSTITWTNDTANNRYSIPQVIFIYTQ